MKHENAKFLVTVSNMNCKADNGNRQQPFRFFLKIVNVNLQI
ncbi:hypothetical protein CHCC20335_0539 [Bacillus paralicheniformis]|nr:hypothetical protein CHCC20335_0539 [Bacillus paralicheniformis]